MEPVPSASKKILYGCHGWLPGYEEDMKIIVTRKDIQNGHKHDPDRCPVARALQRAGVQHFGVLASDVMLADGWNPTALLPLPFRVTDWILDFDAGRPVKPIS